MLKRLIYIVLLVFVTFGVSANASAENRFKWITSSDTMTVSYDTQTVRYNSNYGKTVDVWILWQFTEAGAREAIEELRKEGVAQDSKWDNFSHQMLHYSLNANYKSRINEMAYYDHEGKLLDSFTFKQEWNNIVPRTLNEEIYNTFAGFLKSK